MLTSITAAQSSSEGRSYGDLHGHWDDVMTGISGDMLVEARVVPCLLIFVAVFAAATRFQPRWSIKEPPGLNPADRYPTGATAF